MNEYNYSYESTKSNSIVSAFMYMFLALLITAGVAFGGYYLLLTGGLDPSTYMNLLIFSSIGVLVVSIFTQVFLIKGKTSGGLITYIIYSILMGILLSSIFLLYDSIVIGYAFICTAGSFGAMALYGLITKRNTTSLGMFGVGLLFGIITLSLVNVFLNSETIYWVITYAGLAAMLLITAWDVNRAKQLSQNGMMTKNVAIYMALQLYTDFVYIFIRILAIIGRNRN